MYILPYYLERTSQTQTEFSLQTLWLFLTEQGTALWETDEKKKVTPEFIVREYLTPNGIYGTVKCVKENTLFFEVDISKTKINNFYNWIDDEVNSDSEVWRPFFYISDKDMNSAKQFWGWKEQTEIISFGSFGSLHKIWDVVLSTV
jgi:hypothetical protein